MPKPLFARRGGVCASWGLVAGRLAIAGQMVGAIRGGQKLTFATKTKARIWLAGTHAKIVRGDWEPPAALAARRRAEARAAHAVSIGFAEYAKRWFERVRVEPNRSGRIRTHATIRYYRGKVSGYLVPEFGDTPVRRIGEPRIRVMAARLDQIHSPLNPKAESNGITRPVLIVLMMILRQAAKDGIIPAVPGISIPRQCSVRHDADHDPDDDVANPKQVEVLYEATPDLWAVMVLLAAW